MTFLSSSSPSLVGRPSAEHWSDAWCADDHLLAGAARQSRPDDAHGRAQLPAALEGAGRLRRHAPAVRAGSQCASVSASRLTGKELLGGVF